MRDRASKQCWKIRNRSVLVALVLLIATSSAAHAQTPAQAFEWGGEFLYFNNFPYTYPWLSLEMDEEGSVYGVTRLENSLQADIDPGPGVDLLGAPVGSFWVFKFNPDGTVAYRFAIPGAWAYSSANHRGKEGLALDGLGHYYVSMILDVREENSLIDFDLGPGEYLVQFDSLGIKRYLAKYTLAGELVYVRILNGINTNAGIDNPRVDAMGNVYLFGTFSESIDADPGPGVYELTEDVRGHGIFLVKLNPDGEFVYARRWHTLVPNVPNIIDESTGISVHATAVGADGSVYFCGEMNYRMDLDPGPAVVATPAPHPVRHRSYIVHLDPNGDYAGGGTINEVFPTSGQHLFVYDIEASPTGIVYYSGNFSGWVDLDPGPGAYVPRSEYYDTPRYTSFVARMSHEAELINVLLFETRQGDHDFPRFTDSAMDAEGGLFMTGYWVGTMDFDPGPGNHDVAAPSDWIPSVGFPYATYMLKLDPDGLFDNVHVLRGTSMIHGTDIAVNAHGETVVAGGFLGVADLDPGFDMFLVENGTFGAGGVHGLDLFIAKLGANAPRVASISLASPNPTNASTIDFEVKFSQSVSGVDGSDFSVSTSGSVAGAAVTGVNGGDDEYTVTVATGNGDGAIQLNVIDDDSIQTAFGTVLGDIGTGNGNLTGPAYAIDKTPPTVIMSPPSSGVSASGPVTYSVTYDDSAIVSLSSGDVLLFTSGTATGGVSVYEVSPLTYVVVVDGISGDGSISIGLAAGTATDATGNAMLATAPSSAFTVDSTALALNIGPPSAFYAGPSPVHYEVVFDNASSVTLNSSHVDLVATGTAWGAIAVSGTGNTSRTVTVENLTGNGTLAFTVDPGTATGYTTAAGAGPSLAFTVDTIAPVVYGVDAEPAKGTSQDFILRFSEPVTGVDPGDLSLRTAPWVTGAFITGVSGVSPGSVYTVSVDTGIGFGPILVAVDDNDTILDLAGNPLGGPGMGNGDHNSGAAILPITTAALAILLMLMIVSTVALRRRAA